MMMSRNALGNLANRYRAVLRKCRLLNLLGSLVLAGSCIFCMSQSVIAADVTLTQKNIHFRSDKNNPDGYTKTYDGNLTINITATGGSSKKNYEDEDFRSNEGTGEYNNKEFGTGVILSNGSSLDVAKNLSISVVPEDWQGSKYDTSRRGIVINSASSMHVGGSVSILVDNYKHSDDYPNLAPGEDYGLNAQQGLKLSGAGSQLEIGEDLDITMLDGNRSMGILADYDASLTVNGNTRIVIKDAPYYTYGIANRYSDQKYGFAGWTANDATLLFKGDLDITTVGGNNSVGINLQDTDGSDSSITVEGHLSINASGAQEYKDKTDLQEFPQAVSNYGIFLNGISNATFNSATITTTSTGAGVESIGTYLYWYSDAVFTGDVAYTTTADDGSVEIAALARAGSTLDFQQGLSADADVVLNASGNAYGDGSTITVNSSRNKDALVRLTGNIVAGQTSTVDIWGERNGKQYDTSIDADGTENHITVNLLNKDSYFTGINIFGNTGSKIDLNLADSARWNMTDSSPVSALTLNNGAIVDLTYGNMDAASGFRTLTADSLDGDGGIFAVNTDIAADKTDQIVIGTGSGSHRLLVKPSGAEPSREAMSSFIVRQQQGSGTFSLANPGGKVEQGVYFYELADRASGTDGREWYLRRPGGSAEKTPTAETVLGLSGMASAYAMYMGQLSDLRERLGEIRYGNGTDGLWVRGFTQENRLSGLAGIDFSQNFYGTSFGYDHLVEQNENNKWLFGVRGQLTKADQRIDGLHNGSGDSRSYGLAAYATWQHSNGWYADTVLSWDWYDQNLKTRMMDGTRVHASYNTFAGGISQEFGRLFRFDNGLFVEPQLQLSWYWMKGTDFTTSNGMDVDQDDMYALTGRAGLVLGKKWDLDEGRYFQPYIKGGVNHEFAGNQKVLVNGIEFTDDLRGTRGYYGAGFDLQFARNARLYAEFEREDGCKASTPWSVSAGLRVEF